jgi:predicted N-acetyltransferase YhbS
MLFPYIIMEAGVKQIRGGIDMAITFRNYTSENGFTKDYQKVWDFLVRINREEIVDEGFPWGRWEWMFSLKYLEVESLSKIGLWEVDGVIIALATYESVLGYAYFLVDSNYNHLKKVMLEYAWENMKKDGKLSVQIDDTDRKFQAVAAAQGFWPTQDKENNAYLPLEEADLSYTLPEGYRIVSMADEYDLKKYNRVLWRDFNHGDMPDESPESLEERRIEQSGPHARMDLKIAVASPDGDFVSYCGMWYLEGSDYALVEPVATDPAYRRMGLGKAAVLEGVKRCRELGAKVAFVGSSQQFYYNIGFRPYSTKTWWEKQEGIR